MTNQKSWTKLEIFFWMRIPLPLQFPGYSNIHTCAQHELSTYLMEGGALVVKHPVQIFKKKKCQVQKIHRLVENLRICRINTRKKLNVAFLLWFSWHTAYTYIKFRVLFRNLEHFIMLLMKEKKMFYSYWRISHIWPFCLVEEFIYREIPLCLGYADTCWKFFYTHTSYRLWLQWKYPFLHYSRQYKTYLIKSSENYKVTRAFWIIYNVGNVSPENYTYS